MTFLHTTDYQIDNVKKYFQLWNQQLYTIPMIESKAMNIQNLYSKDKDLTKDTKVCLLKQRV